MSLRRTPDCLLSDWCGQSDRLVGGVGRTSGLQIGPYHFFAGRAKVAIQLNSLKSLRAEANGARSPMGILSFLIVNFARRKAGHSAILFLVLQGSCRQICRL